jgi:leader peptidase (prepilin peptidase)/N-methyltransferase
MLWLDNALTAYLIILSLVLGAVFGSFLNCAAWRLANGKQVWKGRSICPNCNHVLGPLDLVPVFSWIFLKGKCRYCGSKISPRYLAVEILTAFMFLCLLLRCDITPRLFIYVTFSCILLTEALVDFDTYEIPDSLQLTALILWLVSLPFIGTGSIWKRALTGLFGGATIAGALLVVSLIFDRIMKRDTLGGGDIKLFFISGLYLGALGNLLNVILSCIIGLVFAASTAKLRENREDPRAFPFGPAIAASTYLCLLFAEKVVGWYLSLF